MTKRKVSVSLSELRRTYDEAGAALRAEEDRLGLAQETARTAVDALAALERAAITAGGDPDALEAVRGERDRAMTALAVVQTELND